MKKDEKILKNILVYASLNEYFEVEKVTFEILSKIFEQKSDNIDVRVNLVVVGPKSIDTQHLKNVLGIFGLDTVYFVLSDRFKEFDSQIFAKQVLNVIERSCSKVILFGANDFSFELAPMVSTKLKAGLTSDVTDFLFDEQGNFEVIRPTFGGKLMAQIGYKSDVQMCTVRENVFEIKNCQNISCETKYEFIEPVFDSLLELIKFLDFEKREILVDDLVDYENAKIVLGAGRGVKGVERFEKLKKIALKFNRAKVGATRRAVEAKLIDKKYQIGQTGTNLGNIDLYIAFGISGSMQHMSALSSCKNIIAINIDKEAQIFNFADFGIVEDANNIIDKLYEEFILFVN